MRTAVFPAALSLIAVFAAGFAAAATPDRIAGPIDSARLHAVPGSVHRFAQPQFDRGLAAPDLQLDHVQIFIRTSPAQQGELDALLRDQQNPSSPKYRQWLTPAQYADRFGLSPRDHASIIGWLKAEGLTVQESSSGRNWISFAGSAAQISKALRTSIHTYAVNGETHFANATEPSVPEALADVVAGFVGLNDFHPTSNARLAPVPDYNSGGSHYLSPGDYATIYNIKPLYAAGIDGTGQSIAVVGESDISISDIRGFRSDFGLAANDPKQILYGTDPGFNSNFQFEANLDLEWSGAIAPKATIYYVYGQSALTAWSVAVSGNIAPVISISLGYCENDDAPAIWQALAQQANVQGITMLVAAGDSGGAGCDSWFQLGIATHGKGVDFPANLPEVTGVGGTMFNEGSGTYWNTVNSPNGTALSYIPEQVWNETSPSLGLASSGGGASRLFPKPDWQTGPGVPTDGARDVPDLALTAAGHDAYLVTYNSGTGLYLSYGTSAAAPSMAGIVALLNQYLVKQRIQKTSGLGNINPQLYRLAQAAPAAFHDIIGGDNMVPCEQGTQDCLSGTVGYSAGPGYDQATGLGSVDANALITSWNTATAASTVTATASAVKVTLNDTITMTASVISASGKGTPTGSVSFVAFGTPLGSAVLAPIGGVQTASATFPAWMLGKGTIPVYVSYEGDAAFSGSGAIVRIVVTLPTTANTAVVTPSVTPSPVHGEQAGTEATNWQASITLSESAGVPALLTGFTVDGQAQSLAQYFPSTNIPAGGKLVSTIVFRNLAVPVTRVFGFTGTDAGGNQWSRQVPVQFVTLYNESLFGFNLWAAPLTMQQNPAAPATCQWSQQIIIDAGGYPERIVSLFRGTVDISSSIASIFGTTRIAPWGSVEGTACWNGVTPPATDFVFAELQDDLGRFTAQNINVTFAGPPPSPVQLSAAPASLTLKSPTAPGFPTSGTLSINLSDKTQPWTATIYPVNETTSWLTLSQYSGTGSGITNLLASSAGFEPGVYRATIILQSPLATPEWVAVPVMFVNAGSSGPSVTSIGNAFSFTPAASPGMLMAVFGTQLANTTQSSAGLNLPSSLAGVSATINGWPAPLLYVSPTQLNIQVPYETGTGLATLGINNNGQIGGFLFPVTPSMPGIVSTAVTAKQGAYATIYVTGVGDVNQSIPDGLPVPAGTHVASLPLPLLPISVTVGGTPALIQFAGLTPGVVGLAQMNFIVPPAVAPGLQPVVVTVNGVQSAPLNITVE